MPILSFICRFLKHKIKVPDDWNAEAEIRCKRCNKLLTTIHTNPKPDRNLIHDKSYMHGCLGKVKFSSYQQAEKRMDSFSVRPKTLQIYHCIHCKSFHLGNDNGKGKYIKKHKSQ